MSRYYKVPSTLTDTPSAGDLAARPPDRIESLRPIVLSGKIDAGIDLRGAVVVADFLVLGVDKGHQLQFFRREQRSDTWCLEHSLALADQDQETDIEAISFGDGCLYIVGSHSFRRRRMRPDLSVRKNLQRLQEIDPESSRNRLYRLPFDPKSGKPGKLDWIDLSKRLRKDPLLKAFYGIPAKENGLDIEGMTFRHERLYLGFRGPVLRDNYVPLMVLGFETPKNYQLSFVRLGGHGIRDLAALEHGFLILSGPLNDAPGPFLLWWWDGENQVPGKGRAVQDTVMLGAVSTRGGAEAEGLALLDESEGHADVILVYETDAAPQLVRMRVILPD